MLMTEIEKGLIKVKVLGVWKPWVPGLALTLILWSWASHLTSLKLSFLIYKLEIRRTALSSPQGFLRQVFYMSWSTIHMWAIIIITVIILPLLRILSFFQGSPRILKPMGSLFWVICLLVISPASSYLVFTKSV